MSFQSPYCALDCWNSRSRSFSAGEIRDEHKKQKRSEMTYKAQTLSYSCLTTFIRDQTPLYQKDLFKQLNDVLSPAQIHRPLQDLIARYCVNEITVLVWGLDQGAVFDIDVRPFLEEEREQVEKRDDFFTYFDFKDWDHKLPPWFCQAVDAGVVPLSEKQLQILGIAHGHEGNVEICTDHGVCAYRTCLIGLSDRIFSMDAVTWTKFHSFHDFRTHFQRGQPLSVRFSSQPSGGIDWTSFGFPEFDAARKPRNSQ